MNEFNMFYFFKSIIYSSLKRETIKAEKPTQSFLLFFIKMVVLNASVQFSSVAQSCLTLCDPMEFSTPGLPLHHQLPEFTQTHVH